MKIILLVCLFVSSVAYAEKNDVWNAFWDEDHYLRGFKDKNGNIKISPRFMGFTTALKFKNIIAVMEGENGKFQSYYLLKNGDKVGVGSVYASNMAFDCESEGAIRFRDRKVDKVGYFNADGKVIIPAIYSNASPFRNGMAVVLKNAKRICWGGGEFTKDNPCEHWSWKGGKRLLIDKGNNQLINDFTYDSLVYWSSLEITDEPSRQSTILSTRGSNGKYYNFVKKKDDFEQWLRDSFVNEISLNNFLRNSYNEVTYWKKDKGWVSVTKEKFMSSNYKLLQSEFLKFAEMDYFTGIDGLNQFIYKKEQYKKYYDDCGNSNTWQYPVLELIVNHQDENGLIQNHYDFLKTIDGYRLISVSMRNADLK